MRCTLSIDVPARFYQLEEHARAQRLAERTGRAVYTWKTTGRANWLERQFSNVDALGLVLLPSGLPETIAMPDDAPERQPGPRGRGR
uniref:Uncharacterized protein n=1 Tax=candidate division WOR-3 bacterium TaxID=2052148 RepID=A0A7C4CCD0_UNCW3